MDSGNMTETLGETVQPDEVVVTESEVTEATPQAEDTEELEVIVDVEGDQQEEPNKMDERQTRAAWKEEKRKRKEKAEIAKAEKERADRLEKRLEEMESKVSEVTRGKRPSTYDYDSDEEFDAAYDEWRNHGKAKASKKVESKEPEFSLSDDQEYHLHDSETAIRKSMKDYDGIRESVEDKLISAFGVASGYPIMEQIAQFAHTYDVDPAKAYVAMDKMPHKVSELVKYANNPAQIGRILRDLEKAVKVRERKPIDSKPEPSIKSNGQIEDINSRVQKAKDKWMETGSIPDFKAYKAEQKKLKSN